MEEREGVFTVEELASYLRMKRGTIYKHASEGRLPGFKVGSYWRFKKKTINRWIAKQEVCNTKQKTLLSV